MWLFTAYALILLLLVVPPLWAVLLVLPRGTVPVRVLGRTARWVIRASGCRLRVDGLDRLHDVTPAVLVANHSSYLDSIVLMAALPMDHRFVVHHELAALPFFGLAIRKSAHLVVDRKSSEGRRTCLLEMIETLRRGRSLVVFPEGARREGPGLMPFRLGAFRAAVDNRCPIVPITIVGTTDIWPRHDWRLRRGDVTIVVHEAIQPEDRSRRSVVQLRDTARDAIGSSLGTTPASQGTTDRPTAARR